MTHMPAAHVIDDSHQTADGRRWPCLTRLDVDLFAGPGGLDEGRRLEDYPWQGNRTRVFEQIGNSVPPPLGMHMVRAALGPAAAKEGAA